MLKIHGMRMSNYYSMVKMAMLEKGIDFEEVHQMPSRKDELWVSRSPMGKMPALETPDGFMAESVAMFEYLEELKPDPTLLPGDAFQRAKIRQIANHAINYVDLAARPGLPSAAFGAPESEHINQQVGRDTPRGLAAMVSLVKFDPWIAGSEFTLADVVTANCIPLANTITQKLCGVDLLESLDGVGDWLARVQERDSWQRIEADRAG